VIPGSVADLLKLATQAGSNALVMNIAIDAPDDAARPLLRGGIDEAIGILHRIKQYTFGKIRGTCIMRLDLLVQHLYVCAAQLFPFHDSFPRRK
jgi:hypothetical protein